MLPLWFWAASFFAPSGFPVGGLQALGSPACSCTAPSLPVSSHGILPVRLCPFFPLPLKHQSFGIRVQSNDIILIWVHLQRPCRQIRSHPQVQSIRSSIYFGVEDIIQLTTPTFRISSVHQSEWPLKTLVRPIVPLLRTFLWYHHLTESKT